MLNKRNEGSRIEMHPWVSTLMVHGDMATGLIRGRSRFCYAEGYKGKWHLFMNDWQQFDADSTRMDMW